jgi:hypothetical protein
VRGGDGFVEGFEGGELRCEAAFAGGVDDEDDFAFEGGDGVGLAFFWGGGLARWRGLLGDRGFTVEGFEVVEGGCGGHCAECWAVSAQDVAKWRPGGRVGFGAPEKKMRPGNGMRYEKRSS